MVYAGDLEATFPMCCSCFLEIVAPFLSCESGDFFPAISLT